MVSFFLIGIIGIGMQPVFSPLTFHFSSIRHPPSFFLPFVLNSIANGNRLLLCVTPTKKMLSEISQIYLLRAKAVAFDWRESLLVEIMSRQPCCNGSFSSSGITLYIFLANTMMIGHLAFNKK